MQYSEFVKLLNCSNWMEYKNHTRILGTSIHQANLIIPSRSWPTFCTCVLLHGSPESWTWCCYSCTASSVCVCVGGVNGRVRAWGFALSRTQRGGKGCENRGIRLRKGVWE